uniref:DUF7851 domain-containing protein n=1 Tax=Leersia perrieri TaxID=77586 RepID=A0A0D9W9P5_9ORYZ
MLVSSKTLRDTRTCTAALVCDGVAGVIVAPRVDRLRRARVPVARVHARVGGCDAAAAAALGRSKAAVFVFESGAAKAAVDAAWPHVLPLGDVGRRLIRAAPGSLEMARFKFRKGCSGAAKAAVDAAWPHVLPLGDVGRRLIRAAPGSPEMARFKFRKGCVTFYVYAVRAAAGQGFARCDELRAVVEAVARLKDFLDHTAMLALQGQRSIDLRE